MSSAKKDMLKKTIKVIFLILLVSCENKKNISCNLYRDNKQLTLFIEAINDDIRSIEVIEDYELPYSFLTNEKAIKYIDNQLDEYCYFENNRLYRRYQLKLDDIYSLSLSLDKLRKQRFICE